jgi:hypothetical protein
MNLLGILVLLAGPILVIAWLVSEFKASRKIRISLGIAAIAVFTLVVFFATLIINQMEYNVWYGYATKELISETIKGLESGKSDKVINELKRFQDEYHPNYENRARYRPLVEQTVERMKAMNP